MTSKVIQFQDYYKNRWSRLCSLVQGTIEDLAHDIKTHPKDYFENASYIKEHLLHYFSSEIAAVAFWVKPETNLYMQDISVRGSIAKIHLSLLLFKDVIKEARGRLPKGYVVKKILAEVESIRNGLMSGEDPFYENFHKSYIVFEVEGTLPASSQGTLASFRGVQPVSPVSLVDTDGREKGLIPKEVKKNIFILTPTEEQLREAIIKNLLHKNLPEAELRHYYYLAKHGKINIIKEAIIESAMRCFKQCDNNLSLSNIYYKVRS